MDLWLLLLLCVALSSCRSVGYYTDQGSNQIQPDSVITQAGLTPVQIFNSGFPEFNFNSFDFLIINEESNSGPTFAMSNRLGEIETWIRAGGYMIVHTRAAGRAGNPFLLGFSPSVCNGNGSCQGTNLCVCDPFYEGSQCEIWKCGSDRYDNPLVCSEHGTCVSANNCVCSGTYVGTTCEIPNCFGLLATDSSVCSSNGNCSDADLCQCDVGWVNNQCQEAVCFGYDATLSLVCSGNGNCIAPNYCQCDFDYAGSNCEYPICFGVRADDVLAVCLSDAHLLFASKVSLIFNNLYAMVKYMHTVLWLAVHFITAALRRSGRPMSKSTSKGYFHTIILSMFLIGSIRAIPVDFFGGGFGDSVLTSSDDGTALVTLDVPFPYLDVSLHTAFYVGINGHMSFDTPLGCGCGRQMLPAYRGLPAIALFWADHDTRGGVGANGNQIHYRFSSTPLDINHFMAQFPSGFSQDVLQSEVPFMPTRVLIVTWDRVGHYHTAVDKLQIYQCVILWSIGGPSVIIFNYQQIQFIDLATVGFQSGMSNFIEVPLSRTSNMRFDLISQTNVGVPGRWIYRVDHFVYCNGLLAYFDRNTCSGNGECTSTNVCTCFTGFEGTWCENVASGIMQCNGNDWNSTQACSGNGTCVAQNNCSCTVDHFGSDCENWNCGSVDKLNTLFVCSTHGTCKAPDTCLCDVGYSGSDCDVWECYGFSADDVLSVCSGRGTCILHNTCDCGTSYAGSQCEVDVCFGVRADNPSVCNANGTCILPNTCNCTANYAGIQCEVNVCFGVRADNVGVCSGHGTCVSANNCNCYAQVQAVFSDSFVNLSNWNVVGVTASNACGVWDSPTAAVFLGSSGSRNMRMKDYFAAPGDGNVNIVFHATAGFGGNCETPDPNEHINVYLDREFATDLLLGTIPYSSRSWRRYDMSASGITGRFRLYFSQNQHSGSNFDGFGVDVVNFTYGSSGTYFGTRCEIPVECFGLLANDSSVCSSHGMCTSSDICQCDFGWVNNRCQDAICFGYNATSDLVCSQHGNCISPNVCQCDSNHTGSNCQIPLCFGFRAGDYISVCSGRGLCALADTCICNAGYAGSECELNVCFGLRADNVSVCSGRGTCVFPNRCNCGTKYAGSQCGVNMCFGIRADNIGVCSGHGFCKLPNQCLCNIPSGDDLGWIGDQCEFSFACLALDVDSGANIECSDHGTCVGEVCVCSHKWSGAKCNAATCGAPSQALACNGNGACSLDDEEDDLECKCNEGFGGEECQTNLAAAASAAVAVQVSVGFVVVIAVCLLVTVAVVLIAVCCVIKNREKKIILKSEDNSNELEMRVFKLHKYKETPKGTEVYFSAQVNGPEDVFFRVISQSGIDFPGPMNPNLPDCIYWKDVTSCEFDEKNEAVGTTITLMTNQSVTTFFFSYLNVGAYEMFKNEVKHGLERLDLFATPGGLPRATSFDHNVSSIDYTPGGPTATTIVQPLQSPSKEPAGEMLFMGGYEINPERYTYMKSLRKMRREKGGAKIPADKEFIGNVADREDVKFTLTKRKIVFGEEEIEPIEFKHILSFDVDVNPTSGLTSYFLDLDYVEEDVVFSFKNAEDAERFEMALFRVLFKEMKKVKKLEVAEIDEVEILTGDTFKESGDPSFSPPVGFGLGYNVGPGGGIQVDGIDDDIDLILAIERESFTLGHQEQGVSPTEPKMTIMNMMESESETESSSEESDSA